MVHELSSDAGSGRLIYIGDESVALFELSLEELPAGRVYQAWGIYDDEPTSLGLLASRGLTAFNVDLEGASAVAISVEPAGGSNQPTTEPFVLVVLED